MDDPLKTNDFIKEILVKKKKNIIGLAVSRGGRLKIGNHKSKFIYLLSILFIMGYREFFRNSFKTINHKIRLFLSRINLAEDPSTIGFCLKNHIHATEINNPNEIEFENLLKTLKPDLIINQSQYIIKKNILSVPKIGVINRHNALLPKNRGRLTPFWVLYNEEKFTGVSIHFLDEKIDSGDIIVQKKFKIEDEDNFNSIVDKNYIVAKKAIIEAIEKLESGEQALIPNNKNGNYNTIPTFYEALNFRLKMIKNKFR